MTPIDDGDLLALFDGVTNEAFRMETRSAYAVGYERSLYDHFRSGRRQLNPSDFDWYQAWLSRVSADTAAGKHYRRVRLLDDPPTEYQRYNMWTGQWNAQAGEQLFYLRRQWAQASGLADSTDWWMFDASAVVLMHFNSDDALGSLDLLTGPDEVEVYLQQRDLALSLGVPASEVAA